ncbi:MAG: hypothetical protein NVV62_18955 [Terricaulis sp.]|nr:hypothetical protein [Terricaulis sp.]
MRKLALTAAIALSAAALATTASARPWNDTRLVIDVPSGYTVVDGTHQTTADRSYVEIAAPDDDCAFYSTDAQIPNVELARSAILEETRFSNEYLGQVANMFPGLVPDGTPATVTSNTVETNGPWPIRRISYRAGDRVTHAAIQWRPGLQLIAMCSRYQGAESAPSRYDSIFRAIAHPNDATWLSEPAPAPAPAQ